MKERSNMNTWIENIDWNLTIFLVVIGSITVWSIIEEEYLIPTIVLSLILSGVLQVLGSWFSNR